jgi:hypothetical protein
MFSEEILKSLVNLLLGDFAKSFLFSGKKTRRKFVRELLKYTEALETYRDLLKEVQVIIKDVKPAENKNLLSEEACRQLQHISKKMEKNLSNLIYTFEHKSVWGHKFIYDNPLHSLSKSNKRAIQIFDKKLYSLIFLSHAYDFATYGIIDQLYKQEYNWKNQSVTVTNPVVAQLTVKELSFIENEVRLSNTMHTPHELVEKIITRLQERKPPVELQLKNERDFNAFKIMLNKSVNIIVRLIKEMGGFIKANFTIDELL